MPDLPKMSAKSKSVKTLKPPVLSSTLSPAPEAVAEIFKRLKKQNPNPRTELNYTNPFTLLVAVVLSAQMTDTGVNRATAELFRIADTPKKILALGEEKLGKYLATINLNKTKTKNVLGLSQILVDQYGGKIPETHEELVKLPGVGNKTANVVMNEAFNAPTIAVDTHIFRVSHRLNLSKGKTADAVEKDLQKIVPEKMKPKAHHWLLLHGRYVCKARNPDCPECLIRDLCPFEPKTPDTIKPIRRKLSKTPAG